MANGGWSMVNSVGWDKPRVRDSISDYPVSSKAGSQLVDNSTLDRLGQLKKAPPAHSLKFIPQCRYLGRLVEDTKSPNMRICGKCGGATREKKDPLLT